MLTFQDAGWYAVMEVQIFCPGRNRPLGVTILMLVGTTVTQFVNDRPMRGR